MTPLSPTALEAAAKAAFEVDWERSWESAASYERDHFHSVATAAITAYLVQMEKEGFVEVPKEPTKEMMVAGGLACEQVMFEEANSSQTIFDDMGGVYRAMIAAAQNGGE